MRRWWNSGLRVGRLFNGGMGTRRWSGGGLRMRRWSNSGLRKRKWSNGGLGGENGMFNGGQGMRRWSNGGLGTRRMFNGGFRLRRGTRGRGGLDWNWMWLNNDYFACWFLYGNVEKFIFKYHVIRNVYTLYSHVQTDTLPLLFLVGHLHGCNGANGGIDCMIWQLSHSFTACSMSLSRPGHHTF